MNGGMSDRRVIALEDGWGNMEVRRRTIWNQTLEDAESSRGAGETRRTDEIVTFDDAPDGIMKLRRILDQEDAESFTSEEYMNLYTCVGRRVDRSRGGWGRALARSRSKTPRNKWRGDRMD